MSGPWSNGSCRTGKGEASPCEGLGVKVNGSAVGFRFEELVACENKS